MSASTQPDQMRRAFGWGRAVIGLVILLLPGPVIRLWWGAEPSPAAIGAMRGLAARDAAIGVGTALGAGRGWVRAGVAADAGDVAATLLAGPAVRPAKRGAAIALAGAAVVAGVLLDRAGA